MPLPLVGITMGDPAGIGPEVLAKHLQAADCAGIRLLLIGSVWALAEGAA
ncbi:MAG: 4-hydroxythreonine-4-phosphate dehydrogenase PdxA, partial [Gammaproteobacteria bacterium]|nr:4-hydroxythreonine-4-phosphate dehydrogenase PdxA [Gammaproteobacteria bacterium]